MADFGNETLIEPGQVFCHAVPISAIPSRLSKDGVYTKRLDIDVPNDGQESANGAILTSTKADCPRSSGLRFGDCQHLLGLNPQPASWRLPQLIGRIEPLRGSTSLNQFTYEAVCSDSSYCFSNGLVIGAKLAAEDLSSSCTGVGAASRSRGASTAVA